MGQPLVSRHTADLATHRRMLFMGFPIAAEIVLHRLWPEHDFLYIVFGTWRVSMAIAISFFETSPIPAVHAPHQLTEEDAYPSLFHTFALFLSDALPTTLRSGFRSSSRCRQCSSIQERKRLASTRDRMR